MLQNIVFAAIGALILTWIIKRASRLIGLHITKSIEFNYRPSDIESVIKHCCSLFPINSLHFNGATFKRGTFVRVVTAKKRTIEGRFIGINNDNIVCFLTSNTIITYKLDSIEDMREAH